MTDIDSNISELTIFQDVTERKKADEVIQKHNKALELKVVDLEAVTKRKPEFLCYTDTISSRSFNFDLNSFPRSVSP